LQRLRGRRWRVLWSAPAFAAVAAAAVADPPPRKATLQGAEAVEVAIPTVFTGDLRDLPVAPAWKPGDPIAEIPRRHHRPPRALPPPSEPRVDPLLELQRRVPLRVLDPPLLDFAGQGFTGVNPPDTVGDVGLSHFIQAINSSSGTVFTVYNKADGKVVAGPIAMESMGSGNCANGRGDPVVLFDQLADRWFLSEFSNGGNRLCVYISQTSDPIGGGWFAYQFTAPGFPDYPKYGVWPDAYYASTNESSPAVYAFDRAQMLAGGVATAQRFTAPDLAAFPFQALIPADADGETPPPPGAPNPFLRHRDDEAHNPPGTPGQDFLEIWELHVDWAAPANSTFTGPTNVAIAEIDSELCGFSSFSCIPQPSGPGLDPLREVVMHRLQYRNFGTHQSLVGNLVTDVDGTNHGGIRWFELRDGGSGWGLHQEGTFAPDVHHRWMGSAAMDGEGNLGVGYTASSTTLFPSIRFAGRVAADPLGTLQGEVSVVAGTAAQASNRWGDYAALTVDPVDDRTFWLTTMYTPASAWATRIATFRLCGPPGAPIIGSAVAAAPNRIDVAWADGSPGSDSYTVYRAEGTCAAPGPFVPIAGAAPGFSYEDTTVSGGSTYAYRVTGVDDQCESGLSGCVEATATGLCTLAPLFAGVQTVSNAASGGCQLDLGWSAGTSRCGAALGYNVYRGSTPGFTPSPASRIASGVTGTTYQDNVALTSGQTVYYVVRAVDTSNAVEEGNTVGKSNTPTGPPALGTLGETFEGALSGGGFDNSGWTHQAITSSTDWLWSTAQSHTPTHSWFSDSEPNVAQRTLTSPPFGVVAGATLAFRHTFAFENATTCLDAGTLEVSTNGGGTWSVMPDAAFTAGGFNGTVSPTSGNPLGGQRAWCHGNIGPMTLVTANLGAFAGPNVKLRWRACEDTSLEGTGWFVDSVAVSNVMLPTVCTSLLFHDGFEAGTLVPRWSGAAP